MFKYLVHSRQNRFLFTLLASIFVLLTVGSATFYFLERQDGWTPLDALWWTLVSVTTVGYGDVVPASAAGKVLGMAVIVSGFVILSVTTAFVSSMLIARKLKQERGLSNILFKNHTVVCGWNKTCDSLLKELLPADRDMDVVIINNLPEEAVSEILYTYKKGNVQFVRGDFSSELILERAAVGKASVVIIVPDTSDPTRISGDDRTVLAAYTIRAVNPKCKIFAHIVNHESVQHLKKAQVDDYVISDFNVGFMLGRMVTEPGVPQSMRMLFDRSEGHGFVRIQTPNELAGKTFGDAVHWARKNGMIAMGIMKETEGFSLNKMLSDDDSYLDEFIARKFKAAGKTFRESCKTDVRLNPPDSEPLDSSGYILVMR